MLWFQERLCFSIFDSPCLCSCLQVFFLFQKILFLQVSRVGGLRFFFNSGLFVSFKNSLSTQMERWCWSGLFFVDPDVWSVLTRVSVVQNFCLAPKLCSGPAPLFSSPHLRGYFGFLFCGGWGFFLMWFCVYHVVFALADCALLRRLCFSRSKPSSFVGLACFASGL